MAGPGQPLGQLGLALFGEHRVKGVHHQDQITVKFVEGEVGNRGLGHGGWQHRLSRGPHKTPDLLCHHAAASLLSREVEL